VTRAYLLGAMHDGTIRSRTVRISQREDAYVQFLRRLVEREGYRAWTYREGRTRNLYVVEFSKSIFESVEISTEREIVDYVRGYFDADGGIPRNLSHGPYVYFCQKSRSDLALVRSYLVRIGIRCGVIHNPSWRVDPNYWRFYVRRQSLRSFGELVGSWHPTKRLRLRKMIRALQTVSPTPSRRRRVPRADFKAGPDYSYGL